MKRYVRAFRGCMSDDAVKKIVYERTPIDTILDIYTDSEFSEVVGRAGGDTLTYRIYPDGRIYER